jgi:hypothetical protein
VIPDVSAYTSAFQKILFIENPANSFTEVKSIPTGIKEWLKEIKK